MDDNLSQWEFKRVLLNGEAVEVETTVNVDLRLPKVQANPEDGPFLVDL